jgi:Dual specificity phosphatase, catalytic domain
MLRNELEKNVRHYPVMNKNISTENSGKVIQLPQSMPSKTNESVIEGEWEEVDKKPIKIDLGVFGIYDLDDQNDWGGMINRNNNPLAAIMDRDQEVENNKDNVVIAGDGGDDAPEYSHYVFKNEPEKYKWVIENVIAVGGHPIYHSLEEDCFFLTSDGFRAIVSACETPLDEKHLLGSDYYFAPTLEGYTNDLIGICEFIEKMEEQDKAIFVHSFDGKNRSAVILAAYFTYRKWLTCPEAIAYVRKLIPGSIKNDYQEKALYKFAERL